MKCLFVPPLDLCPLDKGFKFFLCTTLVHWMTSKLSFLLLMYNTRILFSNLFSSGQTKCISLLKGLYYVLDGVEIDRPN